MIGLHRIHFSKDGLKKKKKSHVKMDGERDEYVSEYKIQGFGGGNYPFI